MHVYPKPPPPAAFWADFWLIPELKMNESGYHIPAIAKNEQ